MNDGILRERLTDTIVSGLQNRADGPGSDLAEVGELTDDGVRLYVRGDIDIHHLVSEIIADFDQQVVAALATVRAAHPEVTA